MLSLTNKLIMVGVVIVSVIMLSVVMLSVIMLSVFLLSVFMLSAVMQCHYAKCRYAECHYAVCHQAKCHYAECCGAMPKPYTDLTQISIWKNADLSLIYTADKHRQISKSDAILNFDTEKYAWQMIYSALYK